MATKPDAAKSEADEPVIKPPKSKKILLIGAIVFVVLALAGAGAWYVLSQRSAEDEEEVAVEQVEPMGPPVFFPLENMVVNLADPGGDKVAQIGITLELADSVAMDTIKIYLPSIRNGVLLLISQRTAEEMLQLEGKEKLAADILREASRPFEVAVNISKKSTANAAKAKAKKKSASPAAKNDAPVRSVLFSSFIVQ